MENIKKFITLHRGVFYAYRKKATVISDTYGLKNGIKGGKDFIESFCEINKISKYWHPK